MLGTLVTSALLAACGPGADAPEQGSASPPAAAAPEAPRPGPPDRAPAPAPVAEPPPAATRAPEPSPAPAGPPEPAAPPAVPPTLPPDGPFYPDARPLETSRAAGRIKQISVAPAPGKTIHEHMKQMLEEQGWKIESTLATGGQYSVDASKGERRAAVMIADRELIEPPDGNSRITVLVSP